MTYVGSTDTIRFTEKERKILELAMPILMDIENETGIAWACATYDSLYCDYNDNNGKLSAEIELIY